MSIELDLLEKYHNELLIYPFPGVRDFDKFIFAYIINDMFEDPKYKGHVLQIEADDDNVTSGMVFSKLKDNDKIKLFNYSFTQYKDTPTHHKLTIYSEDENFILACELVGDSNKLFQHIIK